MAERILKKGLKQHNCNGVEVYSAGLHDMMGAQGDPKAVEILIKKGFDGHSHRAKSVTRDMIDEADMIIVMEKKHHKTIADNYPDVEDKVYLLKSFSEEFKGADQDIKDPSGLSDYHYRLCFAEIYMSITALMEVLLKKCT